MPLLIDIGTRLYHLGIRAAAPFVPKARQWLKGRENLFQRIEDTAPALQGCLWMHCASTGEFEQGRPVLEALIARDPHRPVLITFFSPSGLDAFRDLRLPGLQAHLHVDHLPSDRADNARRMVVLLQPALAIWVRYEFWQHHLQALHSAKVPIHLLSAIFRKEQPFFRWYGGGHRAMLGYFKHLFVQDDASRELLSGIGVSNVTVSGDTRFDRVGAIVAEAGALAIAKAFRGNGPLLVCGSTWPQDEDVLLAAFKQMDSTPKCLVVPHELDATHLQHIEAAFPRPLVRWSELEGATESNIADVLGAEQVGTLLVDRMGLLARLYQHGDIAFVGGGFVDGIHSVLEAAAWGVPVIFGPDHQRFAEAHGLVQCGGGFAVKDANELRNVLNTLLKDAEARQQAGIAARRYVEERTGATRRVVEVLLQKT